MRVLLALGAGYALAMLLGLALYAGLRPVAPWQIMAAATTLSAALLVLARRRGVDLRFGLRVPAWSTLLLLAVAGSLRLTDLGWSEFQGDEARVLLRAMAALQGYPDALAAHRKVPGEILLTYAFYGQTGAIDELVGRLPFALAGVAGVLAFRELGRELFGEWVGLMAAMLLAVNGYFVAFGRILQYDSLAFLLGTLGLLCCLRLGRDERPRAGLLFLGLLCLFGAILVALGAVFFLPPAGVLLARRGMEVSRAAWAGRRGWPLRPGRSGWRTLLLWSWPAVPTLFAAALVLGGGAEDAPGPGGVWSYLGPRLGGERPYWNWASFLRSANHYLSTPYLGAMLGGGALAIALGVGRRLRDDAVRWAVSRLGLALLAAAVVWERPLVALALAIVGVLLLLVTSRRESVGSRMALVWAAGPLLVHLFLIRVPGTHWREGFPGLALLLAALLVGGARGGLARLVPTAALALLVVGSAHYSWVTLVQRWPEYQMTFPADRHPLDWTAGNGRGIGGVFGVAHRHGWKALAVADSRGELGASYATNESPAIAAWYLRRPQGCPEPPTFVFRAPRAPQDRGLAGPVALPPDYVVTGRVVVEAHPTIEILVSPRAARPVVEIPVGGVSESFDRERVSPWSPVGNLYLPDLGAAAARRTCGASR